MQTEWTPEKVQRATEQMLRTEKRWEQRGGKVTVHRWNEGFRLGSGLKSAGKYEDEKPGR